MMPHFACVCSDTDSPSVLLEPQPARFHADTTEVLQEQIMEFVNNIARIVHQEASTAPAY